MTRIEIPIRLRLTRIPVRWELRTVQGDAHHKTALFAFPTCQMDNSLEAFKVKEMDAWERREAFFAIPENDSEKLRDFLESTGLWFENEPDIQGHWSKDVERHVERGNPMPLDVAGLWAFRASLLRSLTNQKAFKETYAPLLSRPDTGLGMLKESESGIVFPMRLELTNVASGAITLTGAYEALLATVFFDIASGTRFKTCARPDCRKPFPVESKHKKKYCEWNCAHIETVRRNRKPKSKKTSEKP